MSHVKDTDHDEHSSGESGVEIGKEGFGRSKRACYSLESCDEDDGKRRRKRKRRKRYESDSSSSSSSESSYDVARRRKKKRKKEEKKKRKRRKEEKKKRKEKKHKTRRKREEDSDSDREDSRHAKYSSNSVSTREKVDDRSQLHNKGLEFCQESKTTGQHAAPAIDEAKKKSRSMAPMTQEEYRKQQSIVREVYDPESGRTRLVRGTGEIIERIVSRSSHDSINRQATAGDGASFMYHVMKSRK